MLRFTKNNQITKGFHWKMKLIQGRVIIAILKWGLVKFGAQGRNRTGMVLPPRDFKSLASTCFATWAFTVF